MSDLYIEKLHVEDYGCLKNVDMKLSRLHGLVGPNDSGKSTLLRAMRLGAQLAGGFFEVSQSGHWVPFDPGPIGDSFRLDLGLDGDLHTYQVERRYSTDFHERILNHGSPLDEATRVLHKKG